MKILFVADFRRDSPHFLLNNPRMFSKGFVRNGHDVLEFSYRDELLARSPIRSKKWALKLAKKKTDEQLQKLSKHYQPDIILIAAFKLLDEATIIKIKETSPQAIVMCWYSDMYEGVNPVIAPIARQCDWFLSSGGGEILRAYKRLGIKHCAFIPNPCDPDVEFPRKVADKWLSRLLYTGKLKHGQSGQDPIRWELIEYLKEHKGLTVWGSTGQSALKGNDYLSAICGAEIAISVNSFNHIRFYHSDRLIHYLGCGAFTLAKYVPDSEQLFENNKHLCYFNRIEECSELIDRYESDESFRSKISEEGMKQAHEVFNCQKLAGHIINLVTQGEYFENWSEII